MDNFCIFDYRYSSFDLFLDTSLLIYVLEFVTNNLKIKSSPSIDGLNCKIFSSLSQSDQVLLFDILNDLLHQEFFLEWRRFLVCFIAKTGKEKNETNILSFIHM